MRRSVAITFVLICFASLILVGYADERIVSGTVTSVNAKAGTLKLKGSDGKEMNFKGSEEQLSKVKVNDEIELVADDDKIVSIISGAEEEPIEESPK